MGSLFPENGLGFCEGPGCASLLQTKGYTAGARQRPGDTQKFLSDSSNAIAVLEYNNLSIMYVHYYYIVLFSFAIMSFNLKV